MLHRFHYRLGIHIAASSKQRPWWSMTRERVSASARPTCIAFVTAQAACVAVCLLVAWSDGASAQTPLHDSSVSSAAEQKAARKEAARRPRRLIVNNDGNDAYENAPGEALTQENFLRKRTSPLVGSHVDAIFYCTGVFNYYSHRSTESELLEALPNLSPEPNWATQLAADGPDVLTTIVDFGHAHKMEVFWSMRMNDTHDASPEFAMLLPRWKKEHPDCLMGKAGDHFPYGGDRWSALNYAMPEVRDKVCAIVRDVIEHYDVDGIELDFYRHPVYFKPQMTGDPVTQDHRDLMTDLLRRVRRITEQIAAKRGRPILIAVRVPDSVRFARAIGLDLPRWLQEDLTDVMVGGCYYHLEPWKNLVGLCKPHEVPVYACLSGSRLVSDSNPLGTGDISRWRGEAAKAWEEGASGIYTFNRFDPRDAIFRELGDPVLLAKLPQRYQPLSTGGESLEGWLKGGTSMVLLPH